MDDDMGKSDNEDIVSILADGTPVFSAPHSPSATPARSLPSGFPNQLQQAMDETAAAELERRNNPPRRRIPARYTSHWDKVPAPLQNIPIHSEIYFRASSMTPQNKHRGRMYSTSKCFDTIFPDDLRLLNDPTMGYTYCFVDKCMTELTQHSQKVLFFFSSLMGHIQDLNHYAVPSTEIALVVDRCVGKAITGLVTNGQKDDPGATTEHRSRRDRGGKMCPTDILRERTLDQPDNMKIPVPAIRINVGWTGAEFTVDGKKKRENYNVIAVTCAANFAMWPYIHEKFLVKPKSSTPNYEAVMKQYLELRFTLHEILRYEIFYNLNVDKDTTDFGMPEDYIHTSGGTLGNLTTLSQFQIPFKITTRVLMGNPDAVEIGIVNMPILPLEWDNENTADWIRAMHDSITCTQRQEARIMEGLTRYNAAKDKSLVEDMQLEAVGGWPLRVESDGSVTEWGLPPLPIMTVFDPHDSKGSFHVWISGIGGPDALPDLVRALLRAFVGQNGPLDSIPDIDHFLKDRRKANPVLVLQTFFGSDANPFTPLIIFNRQKMLYEALTKDNHKRRENGATVADILRAFENYLVGTIQGLESMVVAGVFRSDTIKHKLAVIHSIDFEEVCSTSSHSIAACVKEKKSKMAVNLHNSYSTTWTAYMKVWEEMNGFFSLNSANLVCAFEIMVSQLMHMFGDTNKTWSALFFATITVMSGNGHFHIHTKDGVVMDTRKPNTTGMDFLLARLAELWTALYKKTNIPVSERLNILLNCARFTETAWENLVTATATNGSIVTLPEKSLTDRPIAIPELRANNLQAIIQHVCSRGETGGSSTVSLNVVDMNKTGARTAAEKQKLDNAGICVMASNIADNEKFKVEQSKSIYIVTAAVPPGSGPSQPKRKRMKFNDVTKDSNTGRAQPLDKGDDEKFANFVAYSHNLAGFYLGLSNRLGAVPFEIGHAVNSYHNWLCFYMQQFFTGVMNKTVMESWDRMKEGYLSRGVALAVHMRTIGVLSTTTCNREDTVKNLLMDMHVHPLPVTSIASVACCMGSRCVDMGSLLMVAVIAQHLSVPVISWQSIKSFFMDGVAPTEPGLYLDEFKQIHQFVTECLQANRFCPEDDGSIDHGTNISCYISGDGKMDFTPANARKGLLRIPFGKEKDGDDNNDILRKLSVRISEERGQELFRTCHMGPESCVIKYALENLTTKFMPDFRGILHPDTFCSRKHFTKLGLLAHIPGMQDCDADEAPIFAKQCSFKVGNETRSVGVGVNIWSLLIVVSLMKDTILHPDVSNAFSKSLIEEILSNAPLSCTPGGVSPIRAFNLHSGQVERLYTPEENRPEHFLRPTDISFMSSGIMSIARGYEQFLPEDFMHASFLTGLSEMLACSLLEVPADAIRSSYELIPKRHYSFHAPSDPAQSYGTVWADSEVDGCVRFEKYTPSSTGDEPDMEGTAVSYDEWENHAMSNGYVITPMIWRKGACVLVPLSDSSSVLGCLVSHPDSNSQFSAETCTYQAVIDADNTVSKIFFLDLLKWLVPVGEILYLDMEILLNDGFRRQGNGGKLLYTRLNVPPMSDPEEGKLYVTCLHKKPRTRNEPASVTSLTFAVNPWDVQLASAYTGDPKKILQNLH